MRLWTTRATNTNHTPIQTMVGGYKLLIYLVIIQSLYSLNQWLEDWWSYIIKRTKYYKLYNMETHISFDIYNNYRVLIKEFNPQALNIDCNRNYKSFFLFTYWNYKSSLLICSCKSVRSSKGPAMYTVKENVLLDFVV